LIVTNIGLKQGIIKSDLFTVMVFVVVLTTLITPSMLKWSFKGEKPVDDADLEIEEENGGPKQHNSHMDEVAKAVNV
jgi:hypothetical protein